MMNDMDDQIPALEKEQERMDAADRLVSGKHAPAPAGVGEIRCLQEGCMRKASPDGEC